MVARASRSAPGGVSARRSSTRCADHLGIGLGPEAMTGPLQSLPELAIVRHDTVVDQREASAAVEVGVRVGHGDPHVGRPARVPDAHAAARQPGTTASPILPTRLSTATAWPVATAMPTSHSPDTRAAASRARRCPAAFPSPPTWPKIPHIGAIPSGRRGARRSGATASTVPTVPERAPTRHSTAGSPTRAGRPRASQPRPRRRKEERG